MFISDKAIRNEQEDELGRAGFAKQLGEKILNLNDDESKVIALYGDWGKGKTSILNIAATHIENITKEWKKAKQPVVFRFNPWNFSEQEGLHFAFLQQLFSVVNHRLPTTKKNFQSEINKLARALGAFEKLPIAGIPLFATSKAINLIVPEESLESLRAKVDEYFKELEFKVIVIIDDIDRLTENEIRQLFQLIKINADFPNTIYITAFDRNVVEKALTTEQGISGREYLEKIVQVGFEIPKIERDRINNLLFSKLDDILLSTDMKYWHPVRWGNLYYAGLNQLFNSIRDVKRFLNSLAFNFQIIAEEVNPVDFIGIEALRVFLPEIYREIANNKEIFTSPRVYSNNQELLTHKKEILENIFSSANKQIEIAKNICLELFPQLQPYYPKPLGVPNGNPVIWRKERRVCSEDVFDTYFVLNVPMGEISKGELQQFVEIANQSDKLISLFRHYKEQGRIARLLEWLNDVLDDFSEDGILEFCHALIEFGDELTDIRKSIFDSGTDIRMPWLISQALKRIKSSSSRYSWFLGQVNHSGSLFTIIQQVSWNVPSKQDPILDPIFDEQQIKELKLACVQKIEDYAQRGKLLQVKKLAYILFRWQEWATDTKNLSEFIDNVITESETAIEFITCFVWESGSYTFGDYVEKREWDIDSKSLKKLANIDKLTKALTPLLDQDERKYSDQQQLALRLYFEKVRKQEFDE